MSPLIACWISLCLLWWLQDAETPWRRSLNSESLSNQKHGALGGRRLAGGRLVGHLVPLPGSGSWRRMTLWTAWSATISTINRSATYRTLVPCRRKPAGSRVEVPAVQEGEALIECFAAAHRLTFLEFLPMSTEGRLEVRAIVAKYPNLRFKSYGSGRTATPVSSARTTTPSFWVEEYEDHGPEIVHDRCY
eukprot:s2902_g9.t1